MMKTGFFRADYLKDTIIVGGLVFLAFYIHDLIYYDNPQLDKTITELQSGDPAAIAQALLDTSSLDMAKGHKLIPYILPLLGDKRMVPEPIAQKMIQRIQSSPGAIPGVEGYMRDTLNIGFSAALTIQSLVIVDVLHLERVGGKAAKRIVSYVLNEVDPNDKFTTSNALAAVRHIHARQLLPFWFNSLAIESESIRIHALSGLDYYIYDRTNGLLTWKPAEEISPSMVKNLELCLDDPSFYIRQQAEDIIRKLKKAGLP